jgi:signal transduction histidine kinase/CheY-like chemotaxis protein
MQTANVARAAVEGKARPELLKEAVRILLADGQAERVGAWLESTADASGQLGEPISFQGIVAAQEGYATPAEWSKLSPQPPLPAGLLVGLQSVEHKLAEPHDDQMIGVLVEMRHVLWVPVLTHGRLRGVLFAGSRTKAADLPQTLLESVAAELALTVELEDERRLGRGLQAELSAAQAGSALLVRKRGKEAAEQAIRDDAVLAAVGAATVMVRADGSIAQRSDGAKAFLHGDNKSPLKDSAAGPSENFFALFSEVDVPAVQGWLQKVLSADQSVLATKERSFEARLRNGMLVLVQSLYAEKDGSVSMLLRPQAERSAKGQVERDVTEILQVIEWLEEGVVLFGANQEIRAVNSRFGQIVGLTPDELASIKTLDDLASSLAARTTDARAFAQIWYSLARSTEGAVREELQLVRPVPRLLERATRPILDAKGALLGRVEIYRDLTAQRVFQSKLLQTDKLAELGQMVTGIAHELSNPLTSILGYAQRLLLRRDSAGDCHEARQIFQEAERASTILRQLLLSARESRPERRRVALNQVVSRSLELQRFTLDADNVHVQLDLEPVLPFVQGDPGQLQQVLMNLIGNARQAIEEQGKGGTIRVKTMRISEKRVLLEVSDDGPGIPQAIQARIFDPFFTTKPAGVGTGLGLSIVLGIVREHGGRLHVTSNPGQGTIFSIELPAMTALEMPLPATGGTVPQSPRLESLLVPEPLGSAPANATLGPWAGYRVLVLEDEPTVARLIADVLEDEGLRVDLLLDPHEALDRAASEDYALAICDMKMPELDGEHFYQALAGTKNPLRERFLFVTGDVLAAHTRDFLEGNHLPHVAKPFRVEELTEKIRGVLESTSPRGPLSVRAAKNNAAAGS